jgi:hypothetical protein
VSVWFVEGAVFEDVLAGLEWFAAAARNIFGYVKGVVVFADMGVA